MSYIKYNRPNRNSDSGVGLVGSKQYDSRLFDDVEFYQYEPSVVVDVILDDTHPRFKEAKKRVSALLPLRSDGTPHESDSVNYSIIGTVLLRPLHSRISAPVESLVWARPLSPSSQIPLLNEIVNHVTVDNSDYYTERVSYDNRVNTNANFYLEFINGDGFGGPKDPKTISNGKSLTEYKGPLSDVTSRGENTTSRHAGVLGRYFSFNYKIRRLRRYEGDTIQESRFGSSIRFAAYDHNRENDDGWFQYAQGKENPNGGVTGGGNPMYLLRNRQRKINELPINIRGERVDAYDVEKNPTGIRVGYENEFHSDIHENVNWDGTSLHITSGKTLTRWNRDWHFAKRMWYDTQEEVPAWSPKDASTWTFPVNKADDINPFWGNQSILFSDRIVIGSRKNETLMFSKRRFGIVSDQEFTVDAHEQIVFNTNEKYVINAPHIYLGEYNQTREPAVLGETAIEWLYALCEWIEQHEHWYHHIHPVRVHGHPHSGAAGTATHQPNNVHTQEPVTQHVALLRQLKQRLPEMLSQRVFLTGGGYAPGRDGVPILGHGGGDTDAGDEDVTVPIDNSRVGKINRTPGGYYVSKTTNFSGEIEGSTTSGRIGPDALVDAPKTRRSNTFMRHPNAMRFAHSSGGEGSISAMHVSSLVNSPSRTNRVSDSRLSR